MSHLSSNIPCTIFYGFIFSELFRITRSTLRVNDFMPTASDLFLRMIAQGRNSATLTKQPKKGLHRCPTPCQKLGKTREEKFFSIMKSI